MRRAKSYAFTVQVFVEHHWSAILMISHNSRANPGRKTEIVLFELAED